VIDDFIRNFFVRMGLQRTSEIFEAEWYELKATGKLAGAVTDVPDIYQRNGVSFAAEQALAIAVARSTISNACRIGAVTMSIVHIWTDNL
jgi:hypothetical protein